MSEYFPDKLFVHLRTFGLSSVLLLGAGLGVVNAAPKAAGNADADLRPLVIHGPFVVGPSDLARLTQSGTTPDPENDIAAAQGHTPCLLCKQFLNNDGAFGLPTSPLPTASFAANRGMAGPDQQIEDPGLAVGASTMLVATRNVVAVYDRAGNLVGPKDPGTPFPNPFVIDDLFDNTVSSDINSAMQLPPGLPSDVTVANGYGIYKNSYTGPYYDTRVAYDQYRKRFIIVEIAINNNMNIP